MTFTALNKTLLASMVTFAATTIAYADDALPRFSIGYFNGDCPDGWTDQGLENADGRTIVPSPVGAGAGGFRGKVLEQGVAPAHEHSLATGSMKLASKQFILIAGCCNKNLGESGEKTTFGSATEGHSGLPIIEYRVCTKTAAPSTATVPTGVLSFSLVQCDADSQRAFNPAAGRYLVGLPEGGAPAAAFGGEPLDPFELRSHDHEFDGEIDFGEHDIAGGSGCCASGYAKSGKTSFSGKTKRKPFDKENPEEAKFDSITQAPYYNAYLCEAT